MAAVYKATIIEDSKPVGQIYDELLRRQRKLNNDEMTGQSICICCKKKKSDHFPHDRCGSTAMDREYSSADKPELEDIDRALVLIENLRAVSV